MNIIARLFGMGIVISIADMLLAQAGRKDIAYTITIVGVVVAIAMVLPELSKVFNSAMRTFGF